MVDYGIKTGFVIVLYSLNIIPCDIYDSDDLYVWENLSDRTMKIAFTNALCVLGIEGHIWQTKDYKEWEDK